MALFKKKTEEVVKKPKRKERPLEASPSDVVRAKVGPKEKRIDLAWEVLKKAHVTEKASDLANANKYIFNVFPKKNKDEIKKAVENIYGVDVVRVNIINIPSKKRRLGRVEGWKSGYKKAIVSVKSGQKIEIMPR